MVIYDEPHVEFIVWSSSYETAIRLILVEKRQSAQKWAEVDSICFCTNSLFYSFSKILYKFCIRTFVYRSQ